MSYDDFLRVDVDAFSEIYRAYHDKEEMNMRGAWERTREHARLCLLPYQQKGKKLGREDVLSFPWDHENGQDKVTPRRTMTAAEQRERMKQLAESQGIEMA